MELKQEVAFCNALERQARARQSGIARSVYVRPEFPIERPYVLGPDPSTMGLTRAPAVQLAPGTRREREPYVFVNGKRVSLARKKRWSLS